MLAGPDTIESWKRGKQRRLAPMRVFVAPPRVSMEPTGPLEVAPSVSVCLGVNAQAISFFDPTMRVQSLRHPAKVVWLEAG
jgi:hypothetical protein